MQQDPLVYILDDDRAMAESLSWMIESVGFKTKSFVNAQNFLDNYDPDLISCMILDVRMPEISGPELQEKLNLSGIIIPIIFISGHGDIPLAVRVMKAGAIDFLTKPFNDQVLLESINRAIRADKENRNKELENKEIMELLDYLTPREKEIMSHIVEGKLNKVISAELDISLKTVEAHRASIMKKLRVKSLPELVKIAIRNGLCKITDPA